MTTTTTNSNQQQTKFWMPRGPAVIRYVRVVLDFRIGIWKRAQKFWRRYVTYVKFSTDSTLSKHKRSTFQHFYYQQKEFSEWYLVPGT